MKDFSPVVAALEGFRTVRRHPRAVAVWVVINILTFVLIALSKVLFPNIGSNLPGALGRFGPLFFIAIPALLVVWIAIVGAIFRQELTPDESRLAYLRIGPNEFRLAVLGTVGALLFGLVLGAPAVALYLALKLSALAGPGVEGFVGFVGGLGVAMLNFWLFVRFSMAWGHTFAERRLSVFRSWELTRGHFWTLFWTYVLVFLEALAVIAVTASVVNLLVDGQWASVGADVGATQRIPALIRLILGVVIIPPALQVLLFVVVYTPIAYAYSNLALPKLAGAAEPEPAAAT